MALRLDARLLTAAAAAGVAGALAMTATRAAARMLGATRDTPPRQVEHTLEQQAGVAPLTGPREEAALAFVVHLLSGAAFGTPYALLRPLLRFDPQLAGVLYGLAVYVIALVGAGPALRLTRPLPEQRTDFAVRELVTHLVFGLVVVQAVERAAARR